MKLPVLSFRTATVIAVIFHAIGLAGLFFYDRALFARFTPLNMLLMTGLLFVTQRQIGGPFLLFFLSCFFTGFFAEVIGVNTGALFGDYAYNEMLGPKLYGVPLIIGVNWFLIIYCCGCFVSVLFQKLSERLRNMTGETKQIKALGLLSLITDGAFVAVFFDWVMEPAAVFLGFWRWNGEIPFYNYLSWFVLSALLLLVFALLKLERRNIFAVNLLLIMLLFFMLIRSFI